MIVPITNHNYDLTPSEWGARLGHMGVVKVFLEKEGNPNQANSVYGPIALWLAAAYEDAGVVKMILEREDINPN